MPPIPHPILQFINAPFGAIAIGDTGIHLHWHLSEGVAWLKDTEGSKVFATDEEFDEIRYLWKAITHLTHAFIDLEPFPETHLAVLNSWATRPIPVPTLEITGLIYSPPSFTTALAWMAVQVIILLGEAKPGQIKRCEGCSFIFFDPSPTGRRKWCSMAKCGNKAKVREFNRRKNSGTSA